MRPIFVIFPTFGNRLADGGAESPKETELRLLLVRDGLLRPTTQIKVGRRRIDMG